MKIKVECYWDNVFDWLLIPTIMVAARHSYTSRSIYGVGFGILWLKWKFSIVISKRKIKFLP